MKTLLNACCGAALSEWELVSLGQLYISGNIHCLSIIEPLAQERIGRALRFLSSLPQLAAREIVWELLLQQADIEHCRE